MVTAMFSLESEAKVRLVLYDIGGSTIKIWNLGDQSAGEHRLPLDVGSYSSGIYLMSLETDEGFGLVSRSLFKLALAK
jgi:hypothetical protein